MNDISQEPQSKNQDIELLRAIAIIFTVFQHLEYLIFWGNSTYQSVFTVFGFWSGVDLFFCISGFVIMRSMCTQWQTLQVSRLSFFQFAMPFWVRRMWRLWPSAILWAGLPVAGAAWLNQSGAFGEMQTMIFDAMAAVFQFANFHWAGCYHFNTNSCNSSGWVLLNYWSLSLEEQFYFCFPLLLFVVNQRFFPMLLAACIFVQLPLQRGPLESLWFFRTDALLLGILIALWSGSKSYKRLEPILLRSRWLSLLVTAALVITVAALSPPHGGERFTTGAIALLCGLLVWLASYDRYYVSPEQFLRQFWDWCGSRSYSLYLIHMPAYALTREIWWRTSPAASNTIGYVCTALFLMGTLAELNFRYLERPLRLRGRRLAIRLINERAPSPGRR